MSTQPGDCLVRAAQRLSYQAAWYVGGAGADDKNAGSVGAPLATLSEWSARVFAGGAVSFAQATTLYIAAGTYPSLVLGAIASGSLTVVGAYTSGSNITLSSVTAAVAGITTVGSGTRGAIATTSGTFAVGQMLRCVSGSNPGAVAYVQALNGDAQHAFVTHWHTKVLAYRATQVALSAGDVVVVDTNTVDIAAISIAEMVPTYATVLFQRIGTTATTALNIRSQSGSPFSALFDLCQGSLTAIGFNSGFCRCQGQWFATGGYFQFQGGNHIATSYPFSHCKIDFSGGDCASAGLVFYDCEVQLGWDWSAGRSALGMQFEGIGSGNCIGGANSIFSVTLGMPMWGVTGAASGAGIAFQECSTFYQGQAQKPTMNATRQVVLNGTTYTYAQMPMFVGGIDSRYVITGSVGTDPTLLGSLPSNYAASLIAAWYVDSVGGSDANNGKTFATAFATTQKLQDTLCPGGTTCEFQQSTNIYLSGTLGDLILAVAFPTGSGYTLDIGGAYTSSTPFTLGTVVNTNSTTPTRGRITAAGAAFADKCRIRVVSGSQAGAITYCTGVNSATDAFVKAWHLGTASTTNVPVGTSCVVDTLTTTVDMITLNRNGVFHANVHDLIATLGVQYNGYPSGSGDCLVTGCDLGSSTAYAAVSGNCQLLACRMPSYVFSFTESPQPIFRGCLFLGTFECSGGSMSSVPSFQGNGNCFDGGYLIVGNGSLTGSPGMIGLMGDTEWTNGSGLTAITVDRGLLVIGGQQFGFGTPYATGISLTSESHAVVGSAAQLAIPATQPLVMTGHNLAYSAVPIAYDRAACTFALVSDPTAPSTSDPILASQVTNDSVTVSGTHVSDALDALKALSRVVSFKTRTGAVVPVAGDYAASLVTNDSTVASSPTVADALNTLKTLIAAGVSSFKTRTGVVVPVAGDYAASLVSNDSTVSGAATVADALNALKAAIAAAVTGVSSFNLRTGAITSAVGDYAASQVTNNSATVSGAYVSNALDTLKASIVALVTGVSSFKTRTGAVTPTAGDYAASLVTNDSTVTSSPTVADALNTLKTLISGIVSGVSSFNTRTGAIAPTVGDYAATQVTNNSATVSGAHVSDALDALKALISALVSGVSSFKTRTGAITPAAGDYAASLVTNDSTVTSSPTVADALNTLKTLISGIVSGVSSFNTRTGAIAPTVGDYTASQVTNSSATVSGAHVSDALDALKALIAGLVTGVSSFNSRGGTVISAAGDYVASQITNDSSAPGTTVKDALNGLKASIVTLVTGVSSFNSRVGGVVPASGDYTDAQITNTSSITSAPNVAAALTQLDHERSSNYIANNSSGTGGGTVTTALNFLASECVTLIAEIAALVASSIGNDSSVPGTTVKDALNALLTLASGVFATTFVQPLTATLQNAFHGWTFYETTSSWEADGTGGKLTVQLGPIPYGMRLVSVAIDIAPANSHSSIVDLGMPVISLYQGSTTVPANLVATLTDPSASPSVYNAPHQLRLAPSGVGTSYPLWVTFSDEYYEGYGAPAIAGLRAWRLSYTLSL